MIINAENLAALKLSYNASFQKAFEGNAAMYDELAMIIPSSGSENKYPWIALLSTMKEWVDERQIEHIKALKWAIENKDFENTVAVERNDIDDDLFGSYTPMFEMLGYDAKTFYDVLLGEVLIGAFTAKTYDGQNFFDTDHPIKNDVVISNKGTATLSATSFVAAVAAFKKIKGANGRYINKNAKLQLVVGPDLESTAEAIVGSKTLVGGGDNPNYGKATIKVFPELAEMPTAWFLLNIAMPVKSLIVQKRKEPEFVAKDDPRDDNAFMRKEYLYGVDMRGNVGLGPWHLAYGSTGEAA